MYKATDAKKIRQIIQLRKDGYSVSKISEMTGCSNTVVSKYSNGYGNGKNAKLAREEILRIKDLSKQGKSIAEIVSITGRSRSAVIHARKIVDVDAYCVKKIADPTIEKPKAAPSKKYRRIPHGYVGLRTPYHPTGLWE